MKNIGFKKILPHLVAVVIFLIVSVVYCKPALEGKVVSQPDIQGWRGMSQQSVEFKEKHGYFPLWTNSMYSGMPAYQIAFDSKIKISFGFVHSILTLGLPSPISFFFLACICFYFFCVVAGGNAWACIMGALAYAYSTFDPVIISVGHNTQMVSIGYAPAVLAGLLLLYQKKYWTGFAVTALFSALLIAQNHLQIVYYTLIVAIFLTIAFLIKSYREKDFLPAIKGAFIGLIAGILGLACTAVVNMPTYDYAKESVRGGKSQLTSKGDILNKTKGGLNKEDAFRWSYGFSEIFTFIIPGLYGGGSGGKMYNSSSKFVEKLGEVGAPEESAIQYANASSYWGDQPSTSGPVYLGAIICFLFIFGIVYLKSWHKWWIIAACIFGVILAWGNNLQGLNYFLFDHLPLYNKFRAVTMSLVVPQLCFSFLAVLAITKVINQENDLNDLWKKLKLSAIITGAILLLLCGFYFTASFTGGHDKDLKENFKQNILQQVPAGQQPSPQLLQQADEFSKEAIAALRSDRKDMLGSDLVRSILLIAGAVLLLGLFVRKKIKPVILLGGLILLVSFDLLGVDKKYLSEDSFVENGDFESAFIPTEADKQILNDPDHANFRVFDQTAGNPFFSDSRTSYHHNNIGGYHPAMLGLYEDIIKNQLSKGNMSVFNMLNTKYFIVQNPQTGKPIAQQNPGAMGNVWLVKSIKWVNNADEEMKALDSTDVKDTVIIEKPFQAQVKQVPVFDSTASIKLNENLNDKITYSYTASTPQFAVFSEVYYKSGWDVYLDEKKSDYVKVDYVLRGMSLPTGKHNIEFRFQPSSFTTGRIISMWSNILVMLSVLAAVFFYFKHRSRPDYHVL